jgi:23S rRNA pseudouridine2605 synthase
MKKSNSAFGKFINPESGARKKERIRQDKREARKEKNAYFDEKKRQQRAMGPGNANQTGKGRYQQTVVPANAPARQQPGSPKPFAKKTAPANPVPASTPNRPSKGARPASSAPVKAVPETVMPLNKYLSHSGVCSRREAAGLVKEGKVTVNGKPVTEPGFKVSESDVVKFNNKKLSLQQNLVYVLLNKPKDYLTTMSDPQGRKTIMDIVKGASTERIYPVGRLDRNTTGVLLLTNDGELAQKLTHPSHGVKKIYEVKLDRPLAKTDFDKLMAGITLEDGFIAPDALAYADSKDKSVIGIEIHSGRNRIVRRIFEHLRYDVKLLDRVFFAGLTKKNVERGRWRYLSEKEIRNLKFLNAASQKKSAAKA